jgi:hypothetical protein
MVHLYGRVDLETHHVTADSPLDLNVLTPEAFQSMCYRLAQREHNDAIPVNFASWDGGRDIVSLGTETGDFVFQCKLMRSAHFSKLKHRVLDSLRALDPRNPIARWTLCVSNDPTGPFIDWLRETLREFPFIAEWRLWGRSELLCRLDDNTDILQSTFFTTWMALRQRFQLDDVELVEFSVEPSTGWNAQCNETLSFCQLSGANSDLVLDVTLRNRGTISALISRARIEIFNTRRRLRGLPGEGLLWPQATYALSLKNGNPDQSPTRLVPPLEIEAGKHARFHIRLSETGYAWTGSVRIHLLFGSGRQLALPWMYLAA